MVLGSKTFGEEEIIAFATQFDPQTFHVDKEAAADSIFGGVIASGWHTCGMIMRMVVDGFLHDAASMGSPGIDEIRWVLPVRPGDTGPNIAQYAIATNNPVGVSLYNRPSFYLVNVKAACGKYTSSDLAQQAFLASGGPQKAGDDSRRLPFG